jgi:hypothetical protein
MADFSQPAKRVLTFQVLGFILVTLLLFNLASPCESYGSEQVVVYGSRGQVRVLPPPPPFAFLFGGLQFLDRIERHRERLPKVKQHRKHRHGQTAVQKARTARLRAAKAAERGELRRARRILAKAERELRRSELQGTRRGEKYHRRQHKQENVVYYGNRPDCRF